ncbi:MAG: hypothetical protein AUK47_16505 [Deltaproteobacteria bacterium CG2_30_63_29]|nr:MAG: hypothetical protein AUK47_16505 [Deltaproteobacteria bacterium CG2_30_63_29]PJB34736.1 MAG: hypothetical protein CO108_27630 [Deltaproteobacteria bacterium CG_4_9_14_3_um_filter_63_12]
MPPLRIGIIGAGQIANLHVEAYKKLTTAKIYAVCDAREDIAIAKALEWSAERVYTDYEELLADPNVDAVEILTPHHLHDRIAVAAALAGKHIHLAKPIAISLRGARNVVEAVEQAGVVLQISEPGLFYPPLVEAGAFLDAGEIGTPISIRMKATIGSPEGGWAVKPESWLWRLDPGRMGGGPLLFDMGYHKLAAALFLMGPVERVGCWTSRTEIHPGYFLDAPTLLTWKHFGPNQFGSLELVYAPQLYVRSDTYPHIEFIEVTGSRGIIWVNRGAAGVLDAAPLQMLRDGRMFSFNEIEDDWKAAFRNSINHFIRCIKGEAKPRLSGQEATQALRFTLAAREAARHGGAVAVGEGD